MWVRNQRRSDLVQVQRFEVDNEFVCAANPINHDLLVNLGEYRSKERALEVLDMIQAHINNYELSRTKQIYHSKVFQMPEY